MKKISLFIVLMIMIIGFASVSSILLINGNVKVNENKEDFEIIFTKATLDNIDVYNDVISEDKKSITFTSNDLVKLNDTSILTYEVTNNSSIYDAEVKINCKVKDQEKAEYTSIINNLNVENNIIKAKEKVSGELIVTLNKVSTSELTEEYTCTLEFSALERESIGYGVEKLYDLIKNNADKKTQIDFNVRSGSSNTNGIYTTNKTNDGSVVYYYRGNVDNNLIFNDMCWKIIRTTETGGVKILYNGIAKNNECTSFISTSFVEYSAYNENYNDNAYVGYMYGNAGVTNYAETHKNINDSTIKKSVDKWFRESFSDDKINMLEDTVFCNDRNTINWSSSILNSYQLYGKYGYSQKNTLYGNASRTWYWSSQMNPTLICKNVTGLVPENNDSFTVSDELGNGALTYPVGLITLDEAVFAGFNSYYSNPNDYLDPDNYLSKIYTYWTMSPVYASSLGAEVGYISTSGNTATMNVKYSGAYAVKPVVSLKNDVFVSLSGNGTLKYPYIVE